MNDTPSRHQDLPLFNPHRPEFHCVYQDANVPPIDPQADAWFQEALALDSPYLWSEERDYPKIVQRYTQAAERQHWKAMMNLVSLQIEGRGLPRDPEAVVKRVEAAMQLGIPAAYDRMGTLYQRGIGVKGDATRAFAFFQRAADMGSPESQTYLGEKMDATYDDPKGGFWGNKIIGQKMLQCAFAQGHGQAAFELGLTTKKTGDREANARSLRYFHEGVKMGNARSAAYLSREFGRPNLANTINPGGIDKARGERYRVFDNALDFNPLLRFPNLDAVLPLPPARLPKWNGNKDDLLNAAKPVIMTPEPEVPLSSQRRGRSYLPATHKLIPMPSFGRTGMLHAPQDGWYRPCHVAQPRAELERGMDLSSAIADVQPGFYKKGEAFLRFRHPHIFLRDVDSVYWDRWEAVPVPPPLSDPRVRSGAWREVPRLEATLRCIDEPCTGTGVWQAFIARGHALIALVNQQARSQVWLTAGQAFPQPQQDWLLDLPTQDVHWFLMDADGVDISQA